MTDCWVNSSAPARGARPAPASAGHDQRNLLRAERRRAARGLKFEGTRRLERFMAAPAAPERMPEAHRAGHAAGDRRPAVLFESWLRHEVRPSRRGERVNVSFTSAGSEPPQRGDGVDPAAQIKSFSTVRRRRCVVVAHRSVVADLQIGMVVLDVAMWAARSRSSGAVEIDKPVFAPQVASPRRRAARRGNASAQRSASARVRGATPPHRHAMLSLSVLMADLRSAGSRGETARHVLFDELPGIPSAMRYP